MSIFYNRFKAIKTKLTETSPSISDEGTKFLNLALPVAVKRFKITFYAPATQKYFKLSTTKCVSAAIK